SVPSTILSSSRRHTSWTRDCSSDVCSSALGTVTSPLNRYTMSGLFQELLPGSVSASSTTPLVPLVVSVLPLIVGFDARSMLIAEIGRASCRDRVYVAAVVVSCTHTAREFRT